MVLNRIQPRRLKSMVMSLHRLRDREAQRKFHFFLAEGDTKSGGLLDQAPLPSPPPPNVPSLPFSTWGGNSAKIGPTKGSAQLGYQEGVLESGLGFSPNLDLRLMATESRTQAECHLITSQAFSFPPGPERVANTCHHYFLSREGPQYFPPME